MASGATTTSVGWRKLFHPCLPADRSHRTMRGPIRESCGKNKDVGWSISAEPPKRKKSKFELIIPPVNGDGGVLSLDPALLFALTCPLLVKTSKILEANWPRHDFSPGGM